MRITCAVFCSFIIAAALCGCAGGKKAGRQAEIAAGAGQEQSLPAYEGPRASLAVADLEVKADKSGAEEAEGLRQMLVAALVNSRRFQVVERQTVQEMVMRQQEQAASSPAGQRQSQIKAADITIVAVVTEFEPQASGGAAGIGGGGGAGSGILGGLIAAAPERAHIALDIRVLDAATSKVLASSRVQGQATDIAGGFMEGFFGGWPLAGGLSAYANTPMEKAIRICIVEAVQYVSQAIPLRYYQN